MARKLIGSGSTFERDVGYSRAVAQGDFVFVSGTTGFDYSTMTIADAIEAQAEQCLKNIDAALKQAGASLADVVRVTVWLTDLADFAAFNDEYRRHFELGFPARSTVQAALYGGALIEIEAQALVPQAMPPEGGGA